MKTTSQSINIEQLNLLMELVGKINSNLELDKLLREIMDSAKIIMDTEASSLFLLSEDKSKLTLTIPTGPATAELSGKSMPSNQGLSGWVVQNVEPVLVRDVQKDPRFAGELSVSSSFTTKDLICVPLINHNGKVIGALQAINKKNPEELSEDLIPVFQTMANQAAIAIENAKLQQERIEKELMDKELEVARTIQSGFWPKEVPNIPHYRIAGCSKPAKSVGGDYYDYIPIPGTKRWGFTVADVTGKGVPASLLMATMRASLRSHVENNKNVGDSINSVNKLIYEDSPIDKFITAVYGELDTETHTFNYVNAGHNNPYLLDVHNHNLSQLEVGGVMLGIMDPVDFKGDSIKLYSGNKLILFSDGIPEARNTEGEFFSDEGFEQWLLEHKSLTPSQMMMNLLKTIDNFSKGQPQSDDITLIIIERVQ
ncbi:MAG: SpoIIE family protein phosphatase [Gracilimonas sp.]|uniref:SpoIIE family protein phosphatase n=1 Tax=Gracilimonas sediminicola TaxID=2952158 RepID=A0A9X2RFQ9_9BACT|nr:MULTISPECIES: GAF domain-containing SpoIIE family protein phosphatase [Gracilimonas]MBO6584625.1 SpoIIE family protein phosphatase [Gracilimonas sp.]MBO6616104.1 SpoIIE family protein phosphatase [Gracilimonas sp.]MCP9291073.1 SpoIIE family protein phosphatase [Gracilimonas sediminicola]